MSLRWFLWIFRGFKNVSEGSILRFFLVNVSLVSRTQKNLGFTGWMGGLTKFKIIIEPPTNANGQPMVHVLKMLSHLNTHKNSPSENFQTFNFFEGFPYSSKPSSWHNCDDTGHTQSKHRKTRKHLF